ncbi:hypothetical protein BH10CHL1_BH10CHL1_18450 [soil metagenome]
MFTKVHKSIGLSVIAGLTPFMLAVTPVAAAQPMPATVPAQVQVQPGANVNTASAPIAGWVQIPANGTQWYKFSYHYDNSTSRDSEGHTTQNAPSQAMVKLTMQTPSTLSFAVWTPGSLQNPVHDPRDTKNGKSDHTNDAPQPVGYGTVVNLGPAKNVERNSDTDITENQDKQQILTDTPLPTDQKGDVLNPQVLTWVGGATASDTYYVAVKNSSNAPVNYMLSISGPTVTFK